MVKTPIRGKQLAKIDNITDTNLATLEGIAGILINGPLNTKN